MKLFYKSDYDKVSKELNETKVKLADAEIAKINIENEFNDLKRSYEILDDYVGKYETENKDLREHLKKSLQNELELNKKIKSLQGSNGGKTKQINKLTKEVAELKLKLEESMTDKYLVRKLPPVKAPKSQKIKIRNKVTPKVQKYMRDKEYEKIN